MFMLICLCCVCAVRSERPLVYSAARWWALTRPSLAAALLLPALRGGAGAGAGAGAGINMDMDMDADADTQTGEEPDTERGGGSTGGGADPSPDSPGGGGGLSHIGLQLLCCMFPSCSADPPARVDWTGLAHTNRDMEYSELAASYGNAFWKKSLRDQLLSPADRAGPGPGPGTELSRASPAVSVPDSASASASASVSALSFGCLAARSHDALSCVQLVLNAASACPPAASAALAGRSLRALRALLAAAAPPARLRLLARACRECPHPQLAGLLTDMAKDWFQAESARLVSMPAAPRLPPPPPETPLLGGPAGDSVRDPVGGDGVRPDVDVDTDAGTDTDTEARLAAWLQSTGAEACAAALAPPLPRHRPPRTLASGAEQQQQQEQQQQEEEEERERQEQELGQYALRDELACRVVLGGGRLLRARGGGGGGGGVCVGMAAPLLSPPVVLREFVFPRLKLFEATDISGVRGGCRLLLVLYVLYVCIYLFYKCY
jgi:hypothetical protein